jgi:hypothetical protein
MNLRANERLFTFKKLCFMKTTALLLLLLVMGSCQKEKENQPYYPCVPAAFKINGIFTIDLPDMQSANVKEVRLDIRTAIDDTFKITFFGRDKCLYIKMNFDEAMQQNLMTWIVKGDDCLNTLYGNVNEKVSGFINIVYY